VDRADGVPIFLEELTKMVLESGLVEERHGRYELTGPLTELAIPTTLQDSLMARLDRLREGKDVAQLGAVLGREFFYELLRSVSLLEDPTLQEGLAQLVDAELLYQRGSPPEAIYTFKHSMIQDTAYRSLLKSVRQQFHARIAEVLEERFPERVESEPEVIARHYDEAGLAGPAVAHYQRAGRRAADRSANEEAIRHLSRGLGLLAGLPESRDRSRLELQFQLRLGPCLLATKGYADAALANAFRRARELCREIEDEQLLSQALLGLSYCHLARAEFDKCHELGRELLALAGRTGDVERTTAAEVGCGLPLFYQGRIPAALEHFERALALYDVSHARSHALRYAQDSGITARGHSALALWHLGHLNQSLEANRVSLDTARRVGHPYSLAWALTISAWLHQMRRETGPTLEIAEESLELTQTHGFAFFFGAAKCLRGWAQAISSRGKKGIDEYREGFARCVETGNQFTGSAYFGMGSEVYASAGHLDRAMRAVDLGIMMAEKKRYCQMLWIGRHDQAASFTVRSGLSG
jgi:tetratricopeptide (TPR) repeat protein